MTARKPKRKPRYWWVQGYGCGCSSDAHTKRELLGYCGTHGNAPSSTYKLPVAALKSWRSR